VVQLLQLLVKQLLQLLVKQQVKPQQQGKPLQKLEKLQNAQLELLRELEQQQSCQVQAAKRAPLRRSCQDSLQEQQPRQQRRLGRLQLLRQAWDLKPKLQQSQQWCPLQYKGQCLQPGLLQIQARRRGRLRPQDSRPTLVERQGCWQWLQQELDSPTILSPASDGFSTLHQKLDCSRLLLQVQESMPKPQLLLALRPLQQLLCQGLLASILHPLEPQGVLSL